MLKAAVYISKLLCLPFNFIFKTMIKIFKTVSNLTVINTEVNKDYDDYTGPAENRNKRHFDISEGTFNDNINSHYNNKEEYSTNNKTNLCLLFRLSFFEGRNCITNRNKKPEAGNRNQKQSLFNKPEIVRSKQYHHSAYNKRKILNSRFYRGQLLLNKGTDKH